ncbi:hypothetical protein [Rheinheimera sp. SA_1]|uniref:hypothetical protein n=1 Tax=Rheinheimera sp. SA_1 TaxID=1827365 RepID=UPI0012F77E54|nr:hypothetical protein [Rheinheimera sp. SA_1]
MISNLFPHLNALDNLCLSPVVAKGEARAVVEARAPAVQKGNDSLRNWVNSELVKLGEEKFLHQLYQQYLAPNLAADTKPESIIVEGGRW